MKPGETGLPEEDDGSKTKPPAGRIIPLRMRPAGGFRLRVGLNGPGMGPAVFGGALNRRVDFNRGKHYVQVVEDPDG